MKVAYLTGEYPRATDTFIQREVAGLRLAGIEVLTCSIRRTDALHHVGNEQRAEAAQTFNVLPEALKPLNLVSAHISFLAKSPKRWFGALSMAARTSPSGIKAFAYQMIYFLEAGVLAKHMRQSGVSHLHNHIAKSSCTVAMLASKISGIPFSFTLHGPDIFFEPYHWRLDEKIKQASFVACISHFCRSQAMSFSKPEEWSKLHIIHCGVEPERYAPRAEANSGNRLLFVGRLAAVKGLPVLIKALALAKTQGLVLSIVGDGPDRGKLEAAVQSAGLTEQVVFLGYRSQDDVAKMLSQSDVLVLPSFAEGVPVVLMEAMAAGLPVITTQIAGIPELVEHQTSGLLVAPGNATALAQAIDEIAADPIKADAMGRSGRKAVLAAYQAEEEAARLAALFDASTGKTTLPCRPDPKRAEA